MVATVRCGTLVGLLVFCVGCDAQRPTAPSAVFPPRASTATIPPTSPAPTPTPTPPRPPPGPPLTGPSTTYHFSAPLEYPVSGFTTTSSYVLYNNGAFSLRYVSGTLTGSYRQEDGRIIFDFGADGRGCSQGRPQEAVGTPNGDLLEVRYCEIMQHSDFENAVYRRIE